MMGPRLQVSFFRLPVPVRQLPPDLRCVSSKCSRFVMGYTQWQHSKAPAMY